MGRSTQRRQSSVPHHSPIAESSHSGAAATPQQSLERGRACLICRKRKLRCDAARPHCGQCFKSKREDDCQYDDGVHKSRTRILLEQIDKLQSQIKDLEAGQSISSNGSPPSSGPTLVPASIPPPTLSMQAPSFDTSRRNSYSFSEGTDISSASGSSIFPPDDPYLLYNGVNQQSAPQAFGITDSGHWTSPSLSPIAEPLHSHEPSFLSLDQQSRLFASFLPHRLQLGIDLEAERFQATAAQFPQEMMFHDCLRDVICLWGAHYASLSSDRMLESLIIPIALTSVSNAIMSEDGTTVVDVLRAASLLSVWLFINGRFKHGQHFGEAAVSLGVRCGLHKTMLELNMAGPMGMRTMSSAFLFGPRVDAAHESFIQSLFVQCMWKVALGAHCTLPERAEIDRFIESRWPIDPPDNGNLDSFDMMPSLMGGMGSQEPCVDPVLASVYRAAVLFGRASCVALKCMSDPTHQLSDEYRGIERAIERFMRTLPPLNVFNLVGDEVLPPDPTDQRIVLVNTLASTALIHLRHPLLGRNEKATKQCLEAAENVVSTICSLQDHQYQFIDPIMGVCWMTSAGVFLRESSRLKSGIQTNLNLNLTSVGIEAQLVNIKVALKKLGASFPIMGTTSFHFLLTPLFVDTCILPLQTSWSPKLRRLKNKPDLIDSYVPQPKFTYIDGEPFQRPFEARRAAFPSFGSTLWAGV
ncbi:hypothetical protein SISNIDRAFT_489056 [Sistotremastrum niveocremeum HHB9708]|uniref:Zn(2)-C6 fungal-type domain-containing protein n=1 Tax=Sistotremastrum niveocremeum HHB9708 TaxID=1314777 RepID=A0A164QG89_9AGAM|nr:hypothetical protein SISNIDRAFT_489056 [Sistotremastrum niveocremeum HHB9708]